MMLVPHKLDAKFGCADAFVALPATDGSELGLETALQLAHAHELVRAPTSGGKRIKDARSPVNVEGAELDALIRDIFRLPPTKNRKVHNRNPRGEVLRRVIVTANTVGHPAKQNEFLRPKLSSR